MESSLAALLKLISGFENGDVAGVILYLQKMEDCEISALLQSYGRCHKAEYSWPCDLMQSDFLKILLLDRRVRSAAIRLTIEEIATGTLSGRYASHCLSEVRLFLMKTSLFCAPPSSKQDNLCVLDLNEHEKLCSLCLDGAFSTNKLEQNRASLLLDLIPSLINSSMKSNGLPPDESDEDDSFDEYSSTIKPLKTETNSKVVDIVSKAIGESPWQSHLILPLLVLCEDIAHLLSPVTLLLSRHRMLECITANSLDGADYAGICRQLLILSQMSTSSSCPWLETLLTVYCVTPPQNLLTVEIVLEQYLHNGEIDLVKELLSVLVSFTDSRFSQWQKINFLLLLRRGTTLFRQCTLPLLPPELCSRGTDIDAALWDMLSNEFKLDTCLNQCLMLGDAPIFDQAGISERGAHLLEVGFSWLDAVADRRKNGKNTKMVYCAMQSIALQVFCAVSDSRPHILRRLLSGILDRSRPIAVIEGYIACWEKLMSAEEQLNFTKLIPHVRILSESLGTLTLHPFSVSQRIVNSCVGFAHCSLALGTAMVNTCRKCLAQSDLHGRNLSLYMLTSMLKRSRYSIYHDSITCLTTVDMLEDIVSTLKRGLDSSMHTGAKVLIYYRLTSHFLSKASLQSMYELIESRILRLFSPLSMISNRERRSRKGKAPLKKENEALVFIPLRVFEGWVPHQDPRNMNKSVKAQCYAREPVGHLLSLLWSLKDGELIAHDAQVLSSQIIGKTTTDSVPIDSSTALNSAFACVHYLRKGGIAKEYSFFAESKNSEVPLLEQCDVRLLQRNHSLGLIATVTEGLLSCLLSATSQNIFSNDAQKINVREACDDLLDILLITARASLSQSRCSSHLIDSMETLLSEDGIGLDRGVDAEHAVMTTLTPAQGLALLNIHLDSDPNSESHGPGRWLGIFRSLQQLQLQFSGCPKNGNCQVNITDVVALLIKLYKTFICKSADEIVKQNNPRSNVVLTKANQKRLLSIEFMSNLENWCSKSGLAGSSKAIASIEKRTVCELQDAAFTALLLNLKAAIPMVFQENSELVVVELLCVDGDRANCKILLCQKFAADMGMKICNGMPSNMVQIYLDLIEAVAFSGDQDVVCPVTASTLLKVISDFSISQVPLFRRILQLFLRFEPLNSDVVPTLIEHCVSYLKENIGMVGTKSKKSKDLGSTESEKSLESDLNSNESENEGKSLSGAFFSRKDNASDRKIQYSNTATCQVAISEILTRVGTSMNQKNVFSACVKCILAMLLPPERLHINEISAESFVVINVLPSVLQLKIAMLLDKMYNQIRGFIMDGVRTMSLIAEHVTVKSDVDAELLTNLTKLNAVISLKWPDMWKLSRYWSNFTSKYSTGLSRKLASVQYRMDRCILALSIVISRTNSLLSSIKLQMKKIPKNSNAIGKSEEMKECLHSLISNGEVLVKLDAKINGISKVSRTAKLNNAEDDEHEKIKSRKRRRLRSRNQTIDAWLAEECGDDAYADLEDFVAPEDDGCENEF